MYKCKEYRENNQTHAIPFRAVFSCFLVDVLDIMKNGGLQVPARQRKKKLSSRMTKKKIQAYAQTFREA